jgi:hypothetical protein
MKKLIAVIAAAAVAVMFAVAVGVQGTATASGAIALAAGQTALVASNFDLPTNAYVTIGPVYKTTACQG